MCKFFIYIYIVKQRQKLVFNIMVNFVNLIKVIDIMLFFNTWQTKTEICSSLFGVEVWNGTAWWKKPDITVVSSSHKTKPNVGLITRSYWNLGWNKILFFNPNLPSSRQMCSCLWWTFVNRDCTHTTVRCYKLTVTHQMAWLERLWNCLHYTVKRKYISWGTWLLKEIQDIGKRTAVERWLLNEIYSCLFKKYGCCKKNCCWTETTVNWEFWLEENEIIVSEGVQGCCGKHDGQMQEHDISIKSYCTSVLNLKTYLCAVILQK